MGLLPEQRQENLFVCQDFTASITSWGKASAILGVLLRLLYTNWKMFQFYYDTVTIAT